MDINVQVRGQKLRIPTNLKGYAPGSQNFVKFIFDLSEDWDGLSVFAQFSQDGNGYNQYLDEDGAAYLPHEITTGQCILMLYGTGGSGDNTVIATTNYIVLTLDRDLFITDAESTDISESLYTQLVNKVNNMEASVPQYVTAWLEENITQPTTPVVDTSLSVSGAAADAKATGDAINAKTGLSDEAKQALLTCFENVAWINDQGQDYVDALEAALYPPANLVSISAVYTQSGTVYDTDTLDSLKSDLVVTAHYDDSTTEVVTTYTLSGTLTEGTSTITVSYGGKTTTFEVTVTHYERPYVTDGLVAKFDAIDNTGNGHDGAAVIWKDLVGSYDITVPSGKATWDSNALVLDGSQSNSIYPITPWPTSAARTVEIVLIMTGTVSIDMVVANVGKEGNGRVIDFHGEGNLIAWCNSSNKAFDYSGNSFTGIRQISVSFPTNYGNPTMFVNGQTVSLGTASVTISNSSQNLVIGAQGHSGNYAFIGKIYAMRIYNRVLTAEEVAQNLSVDVEKYGLVI